MKQREGQSVNEFALELRNQATRCNFGGDLKTRLRDQFVVGVRSDAARKRLMEKDDISIEDAEKFARDFERVDRENKAVSGEQSLSQLKEVHSSKSSKWRSDSPAPRDTATSNHETQTRVPSTSPHNTGNKCKHCAGTFHNSEHCPYQLRGWKCFACGAVGHKATVCPKANEQQNSREQQQHESRFKSWRQQKHVTAQDSEESDATVKGVSTPRVLTVSSQFNIEVMINGILLKMKLDTGAEASVAPKKFWFQLGCPNLHSASRLRAYGGSKLPVLGQCDVNVQFNGRDKQLQLVILDSDCAAPLFWMP